MSKVVEGSKVKVHYKGTHENGDVFDTSEGRDPLEFTVGSGQVIQGFNDAVLGLEVGGKTTVKVEPSQGYGEVRDDLIQEISKDQMPTPIEVGQMLEGSSNGHPVRVTVREIKDDVVVIDANHPFAGKILNFELEVVEVA